MGRPTEWAKAMGNKIANEATGNCKSSGPAKVGLGTDSSKEKASGSPTTRFSASVKGKKEIARNRATKVDVKTAAGSVGTNFLNTSQKWSSLNSIGDGEIPNGTFKFAAAGQSEVATHVWRQVSGDTRGNESETQLGDERIRTETEAGSKSCPPGDGRQCKVGDYSFHKPNMEVAAETKVAIAGSRTSPEDRVDKFMEVADSVPGGREEDGEDGMEIEEGSRAITPF